VAGAGKVHRFLENRDVVNVLLGIAAVEVANVKFAGIGVVKPPAHVIERAELVHPQPVLRHVAHVARRAVEVTDENIGLKGAPYAARDGDLHRTVQYRLVAFGRCDDYRAARLAREPLKEVPLVVDPRKRIDDVARLRNRRGVTQRSKRRIRGALVVVAAGGRHVNLAPLIRGFYYHLARRYGALTYDLAGSIGVRDRDPHFDRGPFLERPYACPYEAFLALEGHLDAVSPGLPAGFAPEKLGPGVAVVVTRVGYLDSHRVVSRVKLHFAGLDLLAGARKRTRRKHNNHNRGEKRHP